MIKDILLLVAVVFAWYGLWIGFKRIRRNWRQFVAEHPPIQYVASGSGEFWRWSDPPAVIKLPKEDTAEHSLLRLPNIRNGVNVVGTMAGIAMLLGAFYLLARQRDSWVLWHIFDVCYGTQHHPLIGQDCTCQASFVA
jgi:hypothetical protein